MTSEPCFITVNGERQPLPGPLSLLELVNRMGLAGRRVAIECNGEIVPRSRLGDFPLHGGERLEIVVAVGGG